MTKGDGNGKKGALRYLAIPFVAAALGVGAWGISQGQGEQGESPQTKIARALANWPDKESATAEQNRPVKEFTLEVRAIQHELAPGMRVQAWAFGFPGQPATVPGPVLKVQQGDLVRVTFKNTHDQPHTIHFHGVTSLSQAMDGAPHTSKMVMPGESFTYEFVATNPGSHMYHCHVQTNLHMDMGMYGALVVEPAKPLVKADVEQILILDEWDSRQNPKASKHVSNPNYFLVNGKSFPATQDIVLPEGKIGLIRLINAGYQGHSMHMHGHSFLVVAKDGYPLPEPYFADTLPIMPGERYDIVVRGRKGDFPFHDHVVSDVTNNGVYPGGMLLMMKGTPDPQASVANHTEQAAAQTGAAPVTPAKVPQVTISNFAFGPAEIRVKAGTTVTWTNKDSVAHTVTAGTPGQAVKPLFDSGLLDPGQKFEYRFAKPGEYLYYCGPHTFMTGKIIVVP